MKNVLSFTKVQYLFRPFLCITLKTLELYNIIENIILC
jgi:hypothetical protein